MKRGVLEILDWPSENREKEFGKIGWGTGQAPAQGGGRKRKRDNFPQGNFVGRCPSQATLAACSRGVSANDVSGKGREKNCFGDSVRD